MVSVEINCGRLYPASSSYKKMNTLEFEVTESDIARGIVYGGIGILIEDNNNEICYRPCSLVIRFYENENPFIKNMVKNGDEFVNWREFVELAIEIANDFYLEKGYKADYLNGNICPKSGVKQINDQLLIQALALDASNKTTIYTVIKMLSYEASDVLNTISFETENGVCTIDADSFTDGSENALAKFAEQFCKINSISLGNQLTFMINYTQNYLNIDKTGECIQLCSGGTPEDQMRECVLWNYDELGEDANLVLGAIGGAITQAANNNL